MPILAVRYRHFLFYVVAVCIYLAAQTVSAHTLRPAVATVELDQNGTLSVQIKANVEALLAELGPEHSDSNDSPNAAAYNALRAYSSVQLTEAFENFTDTFLAELGIEPDVGDIKLEFKGIIVPETGDVALARDSIIELTGRVPVAAQYIVWRWPEGYGSSVVRFGKPGSEAPLTSWLQPGQVSDPLQITGIVEPQLMTTIITDYIVIGFRHILPLGLDHILFVLGLFLLSTKFRPLLWQVSAFTVAHTITLGMSVYGVINWAPGYVEVLIALSIVYVGIENCLSSALKPWRIALVFAFGLLHGMGFAGVLGDIGLPEDAFFIALISFNIGVEFGQLAIIGLAFLVVGYFRHQAWYRQAVVIPGSLIIAFAGLYWTWERALG
ncbi:MAG: HupE/UreJ family protein [Granulosicoccus sp.]